MGFSGDNLKGFILALMSSGFIGASFIIKKKGLRRAAATSGIRAGYGGYAYLLEPLWWLGLITSNSFFFFLGASVVARLDHKTTITGLIFTDHVQISLEFMISDLVIVGEIANFTAYAFAPAILVTPLGALSIIVRLPKLGVLGCVMCIAGSVIIVIHAPQEHPISSVMEVWDMAIQPGSREKHDMSPFGDESHSNTSSERNVCYMIKALDTFNTAVVSPIYYVMFTTLTILASVIMFKDWDGQSGGSIISEICGFIIVLSGSIILHSTKEYERSSTFRGGYLPVSASLSAQLCSGNGEYSKHEAENDPPSEEFCSRKQDLY
ncbi:hypothetical protein L484_002549 [Morus notabilis]|uniref:Probable magnesium transporter n=1 Tax=Morus notabilis TaxID=981085 RepID=W9S566_9ROSA|nr:hypothetical protein L484_002549 [Morus notabilis]